MTDIASGNLSHNGQGEIRQNDILNSQASAVISAQLSIASNFVALPG
jgi:hypothetical protein